MSTVGDDHMDLPPGFRFHPTDEEIVTHYLSKKVSDECFSARAVGEVDLNKCEPWDLPSKAKMGENEWYFFCQRDRKYPTGTRTNRATEAGYWKATGKDKEIYKGKGCLVGMKKTLVFYKGRAPRGEKTNWVMHEYRHEGESSPWNPQENVKKEWVVCRVFHKSTGIKKSPGQDKINSFSSMNSSFGDEFLESSTLPYLLESPYLNPSTDVPNSTYTTPNYHCHLYPSSMAAATSSSFHHQTTEPHFSGYAAMSCKGFGSAKQDTTSPIRRHCKMEQQLCQSFNNASPIAGFSSDGNTAMTSGVLRPAEMACGSRISGDDLGRPSTSMDLDNMWNC